MRLSSNGFCPAEAGHNPLGSIGWMKGEQVGLVAVEPAPQTGMDLADVMLGDAIERTGQVRPLK